MRIKQLTSYPNSNELGMGNTNETYIRVENSLDVSDMFPPNKEISITDSSTEKTYLVKAKKETEFRINQLGKLYRDYNVRPGDEIKFTYIEQQGKSTIFFTVTNYRRVYLSVNSKGTEITNLDNLSSYNAGLLRDYSIPINEGILSLKFDKAEKKRADSPTTTDFYSAEINGNKLAKGYYYITLLDSRNVLEEVKKNLVEEFYLPENAPVEAAHIQIDKPLQQIFYGAPGTGKSNTIKCDVEEQGHVHFRTTFHPDSDYSTFVGCYKPTKEEKGEKTRSLLDKDELVAKLKEYRTLYDETMAQTQFGYDYYEELRRSNDLADIIKEAGVKTFDTAVRIGMSLAERTTPKTKRSFITYSFVPQAFTKAYCEAWNNYNPEGESEPVFLIIEEINRGNCAQIFGDIFQLLDRKDNGYSDYPIDADEDLKAFLENGVKKDGTQWLMNKDGIKNGQLCLPPNLYIWATMNTSDQSLFPIDSAFKRRWDWKYMPIDYGKEAWSIVAKGEQYSWSDFLKKMNNLVASATDSEDKMLGFYFAKAKNGIINADTFVDKVVFYLWNDVFKDYGLPKEILKGVESKEFAFRNFFMADGRANEDMVKRLLDNLGVAKPAGTDFPVEDPEHQDEA